MELHHYHPDTKEYLTTTNARRDPKEPDKFLVPSHATLQSLPEYSSKQLPVWQNSEWIVKSDYRGYKGYDSDGVLHEITDLGVEPDNQWTIDKPFIFSEAFRQKTQEITKRFKQAMSPITGIYTDEDIASFPTQEAEAKAWQADNTAATPFIDGLLANRPSVDKATLVQRIIDNANTYKAVAGPAIGKKQHYEDQLYALKAQHEDPEQPDVTKADIDAIVVDYS